MRLILVRHGESEGNASGVIQGWMDFDLSSTGVRQARATAAHLAAMDVDRIVTSPLLRAARTAALIAESLSMSPDPMPDLMEYDMGQVSGLTGAQIRAQFPEIARAAGSGRRPEYPGEEGREAFHARLRGALGELAALEGTTIAVAHGGVISALCHIILGVDLQRPGAFHVGNCSLTEVSRDRAGRLVLVRHNDTCHLRGMETFADRG